MINQISCNRLSCLIILISCLSFNLIACSYRSIDTGNNTLQCDNSRVLMTNLTQPVAERNYLLADATPCVYSNTKKVGR